MVFRRSVRNQDIDIIRDGVRPEIFLSPLILERMYLVRSASRDLRGAVERQLARLLVMRVEKVERHAAMLKVVDALPF